MHFIKIAYYKLLYYYKLLTKIILKSMINGLKQRHRTCHMPIFKDIFLLVKLTIQITLFDTSINQ